MNKFKIEICNFHFTVTIPSKSYKYIMEMMINKLTTWSFQWDRKLKRNVRVIDKVFAVNNKDKLEYRFHIHNLKSCIIVLGQNNISREQIEVIKHETPIAQPLNLEVDKKRTPRDYQAKYIDILTNEQSKIYMLVDLMTGYGKTVIGMHTLVKLNMKTMIYVLPKFIDKWISDIKELSNIKDDEIYVIQGGDSLENLIVEHLKGIPKYKIIICSTATMYNYIKEYEIAKPFMEFKYSAIPQKLLGVLGVGVLLNDETHMHFHNTYKASLYLNAKKFIGLSATLETHNSNLMRMYTNMFPRSNRISGLVKFEPYIDTTVVKYEVDHPKKILHVRPQGYDHNLLERSILNQPYLLKNYTDMLIYYIEKGYISKRKGNDKLLIFVASVKFATILTNQLARLYSDLDVRRYVEDDPYDNILEADITVSTVLSAGTALDIPDLVTVLQTVSIGSLQANKQSFGRLRKIPNKKLDFYYFYCTDFVKHEKLHRTRKQILYPLSKQWNEIKHPTLIKTM